MKQLCKYCKSDKHLIDKCPEIICKKCNLKGHPHWKCTVKLDNKNENKVENKVENKIDNILYLNNIKKFKIQNNYNKRNTINYSSEYLNNNILKNNNKIDNILIKILEISWAEI